jgi:hypothetical protein
MVLPSIVNLQKIFCVERQVFRSFQDYEAAEISIKVKASKARCTSIKLAGCATKLRRLVREAHQVNSGHSSKTKRFRDSQQLKVHKGYQHNQDCNGKKKKSFRKVTFCILFVY